MQTRWRPGQRQAVVSRRRRHILRVLRGLSRMAKRDYRKGAIPYAFVAIPKAVLRSPEFAGLDASAKSLLLDLAVEYNGRNNGKLDASFTRLSRDCGWSARNTLIRARRLLAKCSFAVVTRSGRPPEVPTWF